MKKRMKNGNTLMAKVASKAWAQTPSWNYTSIKQKLRQNRKMVRFRLTDENSSSSSSSQFLCNFFLALSLSSGVNSLWAPWLCPCPPWLWPWPCPSWLCPCPPWLCAWPFTLAWTCLGGKSTMSSSKISSSTIGGWFACFEYLKDGFSSWEWPWLLATGGSRKLRGRTF